MAKPAFGDALVQHEQSQQASPLQMQAGRFSRACRKPAQSFTNHPSDGRSHEQTHSRKDSREKTFCVPGAALKPDGSDAQLCFIVLAAQNSIGRRRLGSQRQCQLSRKGGFSKRHSPSDVRKREGLCCVEGRAQDFQGVVEGLIRTGHGDLAATMMAVAPATDSDK